MAKTLQYAIIERAIEILEQGWTWGGARNRWGHFTKEWTSPSAVRFCASAALEKAAAEFGRDADYASALADQFHIPGPYGGPALWEFNDAHGKRKTIELMRERLHFLARSGHAGTRRQHGGRQGELSCKNCRGAVSSVSLQVLAVRQSPFLLRPQQLRVRRRR